MNQRSSTAKTAKLWPVWQSYQLFTVKASCMRARTVARQQYVDKLQAAVVTALDRWQAAQGLPRGLWPATLGRIPASRPARTEKGWFTAADPRPRVIAGASPLPRAHRLRLTLLWAAADPAGTPSKKKAED